MTPPGDHEKRVQDGRTLISGECAGCAGDVGEGDAFVVRYSTDGTPGGIFHRSCEPKGPQWYSLEGEAPDL